MLSRQEFISLSLEINLFFQRIMKEHLFFIQTNLQPVEADLIEEANVLKQSFEQLLKETVGYANGVISKDAIESNEFVTPYTLRAEQVSSRLTGASINTDITEVELDLVSNPNCDYGEWLENEVSNLNDRSYNLLLDVIAFQKQLLDLVSDCEIFITIYHEMLDHVTHEAEYYQKFLESLQDRELPDTPLCEKLNFWNNTMAEHAQFIEGMLDPTEEQLKESAENFVERFEMLVEECNETTEGQIVQDSLDSTKRIREFKRASTEGILKCEIKSIILPLLADHVLREANHYLRLLKAM